MVITLTGVTTSREEITKEFPEDIEHLFYIQTNKLSNVFH